MPVSIAQGALLFAKSATGLGPNNQAKGNLAPPKAWNPQTASIADRTIRSMAIAGLKPKQPPEGCTMDAVVQYGREVAKAGAGNCMEQCAAIALYLTGQADSPPFFLVKLAPPADHIFVVLDQAPDGNGGFPNDFGAWNANAVVVDPWVGIACPARDYPRMWALKLDVMAAGGEELPGPDGFTWVKASDAAWRSAPTANAKSSYTG